MANYLLNFSGDFDAGNILPAFLPYTASEKLLLFEELTQHSLGENNQGSELLNRLKILKQHHDNNRLAVSFTDDDLTIGIIMGYEEWSFTSFGALSRLPFFKARYLRSLLTDFFKNTPFRLFFFITALENKPYVPLVNLIEEHGLLPDNISFQTDAPLKWLCEKDITTTPRVDLKTSKAADDALLPQMTESLEAYKKTLKNALFVHFEKIYCLNKQFIGEINERIDNLFSHVSSCAHYQNINFSQITKTFFAQEFSLKNNLVANECVIRYFISNQSHAANIRSRYNFAFLMLDCLVNSILPTENQIRYFIIKDTTFDKDVFKDYLSKLSGLAQHRQYLNDVVSEDKHIIHQYVLPDTDLTIQDKILDHTDKYDYTTHRDIKKAIGNFFSLGLKSRIESLLEKKNIGSLENKTFEYVSTIFSVPDYSELEPEEKEYTLQEIRNKLNSLHHTPILTSTIDQSSYKTRKLEIDVEINKKRNRLLEQLIVLPRSLTILLLTVLVTLMVIIFGSPLYDFVFWNQSIIFSIVFLIGIIPILIFLLRFVKKQLHGLLEDLESLHDQLFRSLDEYGKTLLETAKNLKKTLVDRKNSETLAQVIANYDNAQLQRNKYNQFLATLQLQIDTLSQSLPEELDINPHVEELNNLGVPPLKNEIFNYTYSSVSRKVRLKYPNNEPVEKEYDNGNILIDYIEFDSP